MNRDWKTVPMPPGITALPRDSRGYPITFVTLIQSDGRPDFTTIDGQKILRCVREAVCGLCGQGWPGPYKSSDDHLLAFIGGPISCENQNFLDPPMHIPCAEYAMQVCPHIAIDTSRYSKFKEGEGRELYQGVHPDRPEKFGLYITSGYSVASYGGQPVFIANDPIEIRWSDSPTHAQDNHEPEEGS